MILSTVCLYLKNGILFVFSVLKKQNLLTFQRKAALVTGSAKRLGSYISEILADFGYDLILHYNSSYDEVISLKEKLEKIYEIKTEIYQSDLVLSSSPEEMINESFRIFPYLNLLVNNASFFINDSLGTVNQNLFESYCNLHIKIPFFLAQNFMNHNPENGKVINIIDEFTKKNGSKKYFSYLFTKKCLKELTIMMENSVENKNTRFYSVNPDIVINDDGSFNKKNIEKFKNDFENILWE